jgi:hypothetical protein
MNLSVKIFAAMVVLTGFSACPSSGVNGAEGGAAVTKDSGSNRALGLGGYREERDALTTNGNGVSATPYVDNVEPRVDVKKSLSK